MLHLSDRRLNLNSPLSQFQGHFDHKRRRILTFDQSESISEDITSSFNLIYMINHFTIYLEVKLVSSAEKMVYKNDNLTV